MLLSTSAPAPGPPALRARRAGIAEAGSLTRRSKQAASALEQLRFCPLRNCHSPCLRWLPNHSQDTPRRSESNGCCFRLSETSAASPETRCARMSRCAENLRRSSLPGIRYCLVIRTDTVTEFVQPPATVEPYAASLRPYLALDCSCHAQARPSPITKANLARLGAPIVQAYLSRLRLRSSVLSVGTVSPGGTSPAYIFTLVRSDAEARIAMQKDR